MNSWKYPFVLIAFASLTDCAVNTQLEQDKAAKAIAKAQEDNGILERALKRCKDQLPESGHWPTLFSIGFYGEFWVRPPMDGRIIEINPIGSETEEQLFIVPRAEKKTPIKLEGEGVRLVDAGVYGIVLFRPPQDPEVRKKSHPIVIEVEGTRFVFIFKAKRF